MIREVPGEQEHDDGNRRDPGDRQLVREAHRSGEYASRGGVHQDPRCQPRRDRRSRDPHLARARNRLRGRVFRPGSRRAARRPGGRRVPRRARPVHGVVPARGHDRRDCASSGGGRDPSGIRLPRRECGVRSGGRVGGARLDRPAPRRDRGDGLQDRRAWAHARGRRPRRTRLDRSSRGRPRRALDRARDRLSPRGEGIRRRRREGATRRLVGRRGRAGVRDCAQGGPGVLRRSDGLCRALPRRPAPRRGPDPRRRARERHPSRRARLHDPTTSPEARGGDAVARRGRGAACAHRRRRRRGRSSRRLPLGGNHRRAPGRRRLLLLPRDEHASAGRAHRHGGGHRHRHRARAGLDRRRRAAIPWPG